jgi:hypothetical protein
MPKKPLRDNRGRPELRTVHKAGSAAAALLQRIRSQAGLGPAPGNHAAERTDWLGRLRQGLPEGLRLHLVSVLEKEAELVLFADSAAWAGRLKLALPELEPIAAGRRLVVRINTPSRSHGVRPA